MATTTPNYGWDVPTSTDYVKDGATAIETLGDDIDATLYTINNGSSKVGLHLITTASLTGASTTVTGAFNTNYNTYQLVISNLRSTVAAELLIRMGTTATGYYGSQFTQSTNYATAAGTPIIFNQSNATQLSTGIVSSTTSALTSGGVITIQNPFLATSTTIQSHGSDTRTDGQGRVGNGFHNSATSFTSFTLIPNGTTFSSGVVQVYGIRNS
jgi:hypothetical protein